MYGLTWNQMHIFSQNAINAIAMINHRLREADCIMHVYINRSVDDCTRSHRFPCSVAQYCLDKRFENVHIQPSSPRDTKL